MSFKRLENLAGKVVVIAGGGGHVALATADRLASQGARIIALVHRDLDAVEAKLAVLPGHEELGHMAILASITDSQALREAVLTVKQRAKRCDILVNAAGLTQRIRPDDLETLTDQIFDDILATNLRGVFATVRALTPLLRESGDGLIVNISSTAAIGPNPSNVAYACAKAGVDAMTRCLAKALAPTIRVVGVRPGFLDNAMSGQIRSDGGLNLKAPRTLLQRVGAADDIASAIEACAMSLRFATGTTLAIDGGQSLVWEVK